MPRGSCGRWRCHRPTIVAHRPLRSLMPCSRGRDKEERRKRSKSRERERKRSRSKSRDRKKRSKSRERRRRCARVAVPDPVSCCRMHGLRGCVPVWQAMQGLPLVAAQRLHSRACFQQAVYHLLNSSLYAPPACPSVFPIRSRSRSRDRERRRRSRSRSRDRRRRSRSRSRDRYRRRSRSPEYGYTGRRGRGGGPDPTLNFHDPFAALRQANQATDPADSECVWGV